MIVTTAQLYKVAYGKHGSSSVPKSEVEPINASGEKLDPSARGVNKEEYLPAAKLGVTKVNLDYRWPACLDACAP